MMILRRYFRLFFLSISCVSSIHEIIEQVKKQVTSTVLNKPNEEANENKILSPMKATNQANSLFQKGNQDELFNNLSCLESFEWAKKVIVSRSVMVFSFSKAGNYSISFQNINKSLSNYLNYLGVTFIHKLP